MLKSCLTLFVSLFICAVLIANDESAQSPAEEQKPEAASEKKSPPSGMVEYPPGSGKYYPRRSTKSRPSRISMPKGLFPSVNAEVPKSEETQLGGTVPALWEIKPLSPAQEDDELPPVMERGSIAPVVPAKAVRFALWFLEQHDTNNDGVLEKDEWKSLPGAPQAIDIDGNGIITEDELVRFIGLYGQNRTIHNPNPVEQYYQPRMVSSQFQVFKPVTVADLPPQKNSETKNTAVENTDPALEQTGKENAVIADAKKDITEEMLKDAGEEGIDDDAYEKIVAGKLPPAGKIYHTPKEDLYGVPAWFIVRDKNGDGQVSMTEFAPTLSAPSLALFGRLDKDGDGFIVPDEVRKSNPLTIPKTPIPPDEVLPKPEESKPEESKPEEQKTETAPAAAETKPAESTPVENTEGTNIE
ncbi:hypothetical protein FACS18942_06670 [Planctomycetales bacterium]|nr:hypothetical protein FACS18942_06670 [Planctomycetales bacterium]